MKTLDFDTDIFLKAYRKSRTQSLEGRRGPGNLRGWTEDS